MDMQQRDEKDNNSLQGGCVYHIVFICHSVLNILHHISFYLYITFHKGYSLQGDTPPVKATLEKRINMILACEMD